MSTFLGTIDYFKQPQWAAFGNSMLGQYRDPKTRKITKIRTSF